MGFLRVDYPIVRAVFIDGVQCGATNTPIQVSNGYHRVDLGTAMNYAPPSQTVEVRGDPYQAPTTISFQPV